MINSSSSAQRSATSPVGQRAIAISLFSAWLFFRVLFASTSSSLVDLNLAQTAKTSLKETSSKENVDLVATAVAASVSESAFELEEKISQSVPELISAQQNSNPIPADSKKESPQINLVQPQEQREQQSQQQQLQPQYNTLTSGAGVQNQPQRPGSISHGATLEHPSLRNKMRRYREAKRDELAPKADVLPAHFQKFVEGIKYVEVDSGREDVKRYAAVIKSEKQSSTKNESNDYEPVTIRAWMTIAYSGNPIGNQAAADLSKVIASSPFDSVLFETPGCTWNHSALKPFEFVLVNEPRLKAFAEGSPDRHAFEEYFSTEWCGNSGDNGGSASSVCIFPNLGKDATLISPLPQSDVNDATYSHLASFIRNAPQAQITQFWKQSAKTYIDELKHKHERINEHVGTWFSTNGMGVAWLHLRVDRYPKYYSYVPFTQLGGKR